MQFAMKSFHKKWWLTDLSDDSYLTNLWTNTRRTFYKVRSEEELCGRTCLDVIVKSEEPSESSKTLRRTLKNFYKVKSEEPAEPMEVKASGPFSGISKDSKRQRHSHVYPRYG